MEAMDMLGIMAQLVSLVAAFGSQVYLVKRLVAFVKEATSTEDYKLAAYKVRLLSFGIGAGLGGLFLWPWVELNPGMNTSVYVLVGVLFLGIAGLTASGDYDVNVDAAPYT